ncbi:SulP family inorganic anion transporter [Ilumatobacter nonamiensis]|uniref:SulP family inorganic anion transporter n=1 Tax=Ilumatobacter nonamiensis TaxID=467093 RepID=UPI0019D40D8E|nr:SulP family inorganic anion transporter [Ilumatobacter nonamiensis]
MRFPIQSPRKMFSRRGARDDAMSGLVLGIESVPDGLASGLLAGVNPVAGLYAYMFGVAGAALFTSTAFMAVQGTGAMAIIISDVDLASRDDPIRALYTLSILTGVVMIVAGLFRFGTFLRFVSSSVMTGFISAVGVNIVLGQLDDFTGYAASGSNRVTRAVDLVLHFWKVDLATVAVGVITIVLIVMLQRTSLGALGLVVAVFVGSAIAAVLAALDNEIALVADIATVPSGLPAPVLPVLSDVPALIVPALSLAFVGLIQGAGVSTGFPNDDGTPTDESQDFVAQGAGNVAAGFFQGMPVGGSMSASSLMVTAGARSRQAAFFAAGVMAIVVMVFGGVIEQIAMPSLAALLIVVGVGTVRVPQIVSVAKTGTVPLTAMVTTFVLTLLVPLQFAVLVGVGIAVILFVVQQSGHLVTKQVLFHDDGTVEEVDPPEEVPAGEVVVLHPYGALFFATSARLGEQMPTVTPASDHAVVILRVRGADDAGVTLLDMLTNYADELSHVGSKLMIVTDNRRVIRQLRVTGATAAIGEHNIYRSTRFVGESTRRAYTDAVEWIADRSPTPPTGRAVDNDPESGERGET